jgi:thiamine kinase-like enzyme
MSPHDDLDAVLDRIDVLRDRHSVSDLPGGLTNRNLKVECPSATYVVRLSSPSAGLLSVDREIEYRNTLAAAETVGAGVVDYLAGEGVLVIDWIEGTTLTPHALHEEAMMPRVASACRKLHAGPRFVNDFDKFVLQRQYLNVVLERGFRLPPRYREFEPQAERIRAALAINAVATVPCNNDLLAGNFIDTGSELRLIDYEYSGNNDPYFEIGNVWSESTLPLDHLELLVTAYDGSHLRNRIARARLLALMSKYGWMLWASLRRARRLARVRRHPAQSRTVRSRQCAGSRVTTREPQVGERCDDATLQQLRRGVPSAERARSR